MNYIWIERTTNTYSDCLKAYGIAYLLNLLIDQSSSKIFIRHSPSHYLIELPHEIISNWELFVDEFEPIYLLPVLNNTDERLSDASTVYLKTEKEKREGYQTYKREGQENKGLGEMPTPEHSHYHIFSLYQGMKVTTAHNKMAEVLQQDPEIIKIIFEWIFRVCTIPYVDSVEKIKVYKEIIKKYESKSGKKVLLANSVNALSFFNPIQAKGVNNHSASGINPGGMKSFVLDEFFKMIGILQSSIGRLIKVGTRSYDCMLQVIEPKEISIEAVSNIVQKIKTKVKAPTRTYLELSTLTYTISEVLRSLIDKKLHLNPSITDYINGLYSTYFKDLGNAKAVMNLSYYSLPSWVKFESYEDVYQYDALFNEIISRCDKIRRDENLLQELDQPLNHLVTFISSGSLDHFLFFVQEYHFKVFSCIYEKKYWLDLKPFSIKHLQEVIMKSNQPYSRIVEDQGFINISRAIFSATLGLQYQDKSVRKYPVHYDLQHMLKQNAPYKEKFITILTDFASTYNSENARVFESSRARGNDGRTRKNITDIDLASVIQLVDEYGSNIVGNLLVAFGYAKKEKANEQNDNDQNDYDEELFED
ncbi:hypothetical protein M670_02829 [Schinkia azotoformans MEV2011]|uniref:Uncharacterized protein n=1 Tax=Schinkia azotoformans MEV2011 TaxID=1348973 RepID=A0A072NLJ2_SCHAZ|nr:hypothetical protein [Schinkia azotoformans]KEF37798.1 hypothetical protein M670_02829 [Schinkia azotoformans MEV2011]MEC1693918.1 hypothetical protein [Schinkia azotoformans]MEC1724737.1 hypothetical protein [Schinkia azotoformans]MEC1780556.1 hypothetical protein [Schinkia azotoformans]MED4328470.1 hypothetical protein [Schinkia azotoformans]